MNRLIRFIYIYRDASNNKQWGSVDFTNPTERSIKNIEQECRQHLDSKELFIAHQIGLPELFFYATEPVTEDDHCFHEFVSLEAIELTDATHPTRSISEFLCTIKASATEGWEVFNPADRLPELTIYPQDQ